MTAAGNDIVDQAIAWHIRLADASAEEWTVFIDWLEASAAHRDTYDRIALDDALLTPTLELDAMPTPANENRPARRLHAWSAAGGGLLMATLIGFVLLPQEAPPAFYTVETQPGARHVVRLESGTTIEMNGGSRLTFRRNDRRYAALEAGEATFHVRHDAEHPFELRAGGAVIRDLGTLFNVTREGRRLSVQVAEGAVQYKTEGAMLTLKPGMALTIDEASGRSVVESVAPSAVGGWRSGTAEFRDAPISAVAGMVERTTGARVQVEPALARRPFTGTVNLDAARGSVVPRVAALMNAGWRRDGKAWVLFAKDDDDR